MCNVDANIASSFSDNTVGCKFVSSDEDFEVVHSLTSNSTEPYAEGLGPGSYAVVKLCRKRYVSFVSSISLEDGEAEVSLLTPSLPSESFTWLSELRSFVVPLTEVVCVVTLCEKDDLYHLTKEDKAVLKGLQILKG